MPIAEPTAPVIAVPQVPLVAVVTAPTVTAPPVAAPPVAAPMVTEDSAVTDADTGSDIENGEHETDFFYRTLVRRGDNFITNIWNTWYEPAAFEV